MNEVDYLLKNPFKRLSLEIQTEIVRLGPNQPKDFTFTQKCVKFTQSFNAGWFQKKTWLTCSPGKSAIFCFPCILFSDIPSVWTTTGVSDLKHVNDKIKKKHECTSGHITNVLRLRMFGKVNIDRQLDEHTEKASVITTNVLIKIGMY